MRLAVICDSTGSENNGASFGSWPAYLGDLIRSLGVLDWTVDNFSIPGLQWRSAHVPSIGFMVGNLHSPVDAIKLQPQYDLILVSLGTNDRTNPDALADYQAFRNSLNALNCSVAFVGQHYILPDDTVSNNCIVTLPEAEAIEEVYSHITDKFYGAAFGKLHEMEYNFDGIHFTDSGKQWIAASVYMGLQADYPLTPITRNIAWLWVQSPEVKAQMKRANT